MKKGFIHRRNGVIRFWFLGGLSSAALALTPLGFDSGDEIFLDRFEPLPDWVTVSGTVVVSESDLADVGSWDVDNFVGYRVRVAGTDWSVQPSPDGSFSLEVPPRENVVLLFDEPAGLDRFQKVSKRLALHVPVSGLDDADFVLQWKWHVLPSEDSVAGVRSKLSSHFTDESTGWVLMHDYAAGPEPAQRRLLQTTDGGESWDELAVWPEPASGPWPAGPIYFADASHGWITGQTYPGGVYWTQDGGETWGYAGLPDPYSYADVHGVTANLFRVAGDRVFASGQVHYVSGGGIAGSPGVIWQSLDDGASWKTTLHDVPTVTAMGGAPDGRAVAFMTNFETMWTGPWRRAHWDTAASEWIEAPEDNEWAVNSGHGTKYIPFEEQSGRFYAPASQGPVGVYTSEDGIEWERVSTGGGGTGYLDLGTANKAWSYTGTMHVSYDGGRNWLVEGMAGSGGIVCCHGPDVFAFDSHSAIWRMVAGVDPIARYIDPPVESFEILPFALRPTDSGVVPGQSDVPMLGLRVINRGTSPLTNGSITLTLEGTGVPDQVSSAKIYQDANGLGVLAVEHLLSLGSFEPVDRTVTLPLDGLTVPEGQTAELIVAFDFAAEAPLGLTYGVSLRPAEDSEFAAESGTIPPDAPSSHQLISPLVQTMATLFTDQFFDLDDWQADPTSPGWELFAETAFSAPTSVRIVDGLETFTSSSLTQAQAVSLAGVTNPLLSFWERHAFNNNQGFRMEGRVEVSANNGATWTAVLAYIPPGGGLSRPRYAETIVDLSGFANQEILIRFRFSQNQGWGTAPSFWNIDDVRIFDGSGGVP